jgi:hypothetical protein
VRKSELKLELKIAESKADLIRWVVGTGFAQILAVLAIIKMHL